MTDNKTEATASTVIELQPITGANLRAATSATRETLLGKKNRITIGHPLINKINPKENETPITQADLQRFDPNTYAFNQIELSLTLLPDRNCRFVSADLVVELSPTSGDLPLLLRLYPERETALRTVAKTKEEGAKAGIKENLLKLLDAGIEVKQAREEQWEQQTVHLESFGAQSSEGGWRLSMTEQREIPLDTRGLRLITVHKKGKALSLEVRVVAEIEVLTGIDKWLTWAFGARKDNAPTLQYTIASA